MDYYNIKVPWYHSSGAQIFSCSFSHESILKQNLYQPSIIYNG